MPLLPIALGLAQFAPSLMRFFGAGQDSTAVAEKVVGIAQTLSGSPSPEAALQALRESAALQSRFQEAVLQLDADLEKAYLADRAGARARDVEYVRAGRHNARADLMVLFDVVGLVACLVVLGFYRTGIPAEVVTLVTTIASIFGLCLRDAHQFEFGSSRGSREKDDLLARSALNPASRPGATP